MDLVDSVTQNSNNRNTTMENQGSNGTINSNNNNDDGNDSKSGNKNQGLYESTEKGTQQHASEAGPEGKAPAQRAQVPDYLRAIGMDPRKFWPKKYRFTREKSPGQHNPLTIAQRNFYESNGYIVLDDCVSRRLLDQVKLIKSQQQQQTNAFASRAAKDNDFVDEFLLDKLLVKNNRLAQYVKCFCDEKFMLMTHRLVEHFQSNEMSGFGADKAAGSGPHQGLNINDLESQLLANGGRQTLFRDWIYLPFRPIDKVVSVVVALEPIEHVILVVPGTHRVGQCTISSTLDSISAAYESSQERPGPDSNAAQISREIFESSPDKLSTLVSKSRRGFKYVNLKAGQTLFYHPGLVHGYSSDLVNFKKRQLASLAYYAAADCEFVDLRRSLTFERQDEAANEASQQQASEKVPISLAHFGDSNPRDYRSWLNKPRLVHEPRANL